MGYKQFLTPIDLNGNEIANLRLQNLASRPGSPNTGSVIWNTGTSFTEIYNGSGWDQLATVAWVNTQLANAGAGDMLKNEYDSNDDGKVDAADLADTVPLTGISGSTAFGQSILSAANASAARTSLGLGSLAALSTVGTASFANSSVTNVKLASVPTGTIKGRSSSGTGAVEDLSTTQVKGLLNVQVSDVSGLQTTLNGLSQNGHTHVAADIADFDAAAQAAAASWLDTAAGANNQVDTALELINKVLSNESSLSQIIGRHSENIGDGSATSFAESHNLGSEDVHVFIKDNTTKALVEADVVVTNANVVTISMSDAPAANAYRVIVKH